MSEWATQNMRRSIGQRQGAIEKIAIPRITKKMGTFSRLQVPFAEMSGDPVQFARQHLASLLAYSSLRRPPVRLPPF